MVRTLLKPSQITALLSFTVFGVCVHGVSKFAMRCLQTIAFYTKLFVIVAVSP